MKGSPVCASLCPFLPKNADSMRLVVTKPPKDGSIEQASFSLTRRYRTGLILPNRRYNQGVTTLVYPGCNNGGIPRVVTVVHTQGGNSGTYPGWYHGRYPEDGTMVGILGTLVGIPYSLYASLYTLGIPHVPRRVLHVRCTTDRHRQCGTTRPWAQDGRLAWVTRRREPPNLKSVTGEREDAQSYSALPVDNRKKIG